MRAKNSGRQTETMGSAGEAASASKLLKQWRFMLALATDRELTGLDLRVAMLLVELYNDAKGYAWPTYKQLSDFFGVSERAVLNTVNRLVASGWFERASGRGRGQANEYRPRWKKANGSSVFRPKNPNESSPFRPKNPNQSSAFPTKNPNESSVENPNESSVHNSYDSAYGEREGLPPLTPPSASAEQASRRTAFDAFWQQYPKQERRAAAEKEFYRVIGAKKATPGELIGGAMRYAQAVSDREPKFIKFPDNWLRAEGWRDSTEPTPAAPGRGRRSFEDIARNFLSDPERWKL